MDRRKNKYDLLVDKVLRHSDIILIVADARMVKFSRNKSVENKIRIYKKRFMYVINKIDLITKKEQDKIDLPNSIEISATKHIGTLRLLDRIKKLAGDREVTVGVVGFPNTGKSTIINALKGRKSAPTSSVSGYTKGLQKIRISKNIMMIDTPGVLSYSKRTDLVLMGAVNVESLEDPELTAMEIIQSMNGVVEKYFGVEVKYDVSETLEDIARKKNVFKKGGVPDTKRMSVEIIRMCQKGKIRFSK